MPDILDLTAANKITLYRLNFMWKARFKPKYKQGFSRDRHKVSFITFILDDIRKANKQS